MLKVNVNKLNKLFNNATKQVTNKIPKKLNDKNINDSTMNTLSNYHQNPYFISTK